MQRGNNRQARFASDADLAAFANWLREGGNRYSVSILRTILGRFYSDPKHHKHHLKDDCLGTCVFEAVGSRAGPASTA